MHGLEAPGRCCWIEAAEGTSEDNMEELEASCVEWAPK